MHRVRTFVLETYKEGEKNKHRKKEKIQPKGRKRNHVVEKSWSVACIYIYNCVKVYKEETRDEFASAQVGIEKRCGPPREQVYFLTFSRVCLFLSSLSLFIIIFFSFALSMHPRPQERGKTTLPRACTSRKLRFTFFFFSSSPPPHSRAARSSDMPWRFKSRKEFFELKFRLVYCNFFFCRSLFYVWFFVGN